jgi:hypothetical protein
MTDKSTCVLEAILISNNKAEYRVSKAGLLYSNQELSNNIRNYSILLFQKTLMDVK